MKESELYGSLFGIGVFRERRHVMKWFGEKIGPGFVWVLLSLSTIFFTAEAMAEDKVIKMSTTTSTENSGLLDVMLPEFTKETGIQVKVFAKGTGAAIRDGKDGNVDIIFVHAKEREEQFVSDGFGAYRLGVMHNDFVILGPKGDPASIRGMDDAVGAFRRVAETKSSFVSRGDDSGTHTKEQALWKATGIPMRTDKTEIIKKGKRRSLTFQYPGGLGKWYLSIGQGMGKTLTYAEEKGAYTLSDRGTYIKYRYGRAQGFELHILCEGDQRLHNPYGIIPINPKRFPHVQFEWADHFAKWLVSEKAQRLIADFKIEGHQAFFPDAIKVSR
jgi:tungstate transport system substrate-binding protein